jgi:arachidonate 15-lipoxygenase
MFESKKFVLATASNLEERAKGLDRKRYQWHHDYLKGVPTLRNSTLGDGTRALGGASPTTQDVNAPHPSLADLLLSDEQNNELTRIADEQGEDALSAPDVLKGNPLFAPVGDGATRDLFGKLNSTDGYDKKTGVPLADVPVFPSYILPRVLFVGNSADLNKKLLAANKPLQAPADYKALYQAYLDDSRRPTRAGAKVIGFDQLPETFDTDAMFGWQRLAGCNPRVVKALTREKIAPLRQKMPLTDAHVAAVAGAGATIESEIAANRLYFCDYALLDGVPLQEGRHMPAAIGVFWSDAKNLNLAPVAIQLGQTPGRIRTPGEADWDVARVLFSVADFNYHEMGTHLSEAHFAQEAFAVATRRNLPEIHPIGALLLQIYWVLLYNNALGRLQLVNKGGFADRMMASELEHGSLRIVADYYNKVWSFHDWDLEDYLGRQGTLDTKALPVYPYRDDGLPMWAAIKAFAAEYVGAYYAAASDVATDHELQAWVAELCDETKGNLARKGFPTAVKDKEQLSAVLAKLIWQAGPGHAGINFSQFQFFAFVPNSPGAAYATEGGLMKVLPPLAKALDQGDILNVITQKVFGRIGEFDEPFREGLNPLATNAVTNYQRALAACATAVDGRNAALPRASKHYPFLHPHNVPNSTNI